MAQLQHWIVTCTTCDSPAEYHCNTCGDILCPRCREIHQRSRGTCHHSIVPYRERVEPGKVTGQCDIHQGNPWILWDQTCSKAVCTECVTSADHKGHSYERIAAKMDEQRKAIQEEFDMYSKLLNTWQERLKQIQSNMKAYEIEVDELGEEISREAHRVREHVRRTEVALMQELQEMKYFEKAIVQEKEQTLKTEIEKIEQQIKKAEELLRSDDVSTLLQYRVKKDKGNIFTPPEAEPLPLPVFTHGSVDMESILGSLSVPKKTQDRSEGVKFKQTENQTALGDSRTTVSHEEQSQTISTTSCSASSRMSLIPTATVISTIQTSTYYKSYLACKGSDQAWVKTGENVIQLFERQGVSVKTITTNSAIRRMAFSPLGDLLISDYDEEAIKLVTENGKIKTLFRTEWRPYGICCLQNGDILAAFYFDGRVVHYSRVGKVVKELNRSLFRHPRNVAQNSINNHIYVCDHTTLGTGAAGKVLAFKEDTSKLLYKYTGPDATTFTPWDVCSDQAGHVIITDYSNDRIHILDQHGRFLQYMMTKDQGLHRPLSIDTDNDGYAWVCEWEYEETSQVKILKYMN